MKNDYKRPTPSSLFYAITDRCSTS